MSHQSKLYLVTGGAGFIGSNITEALVRRGECCGRQFTLFGPRSVRLGAVWAADRNDLYFYDARGERFRKERMAGPLGDAA